MPGVNKKIKAELNVRQLFKNFNNLPLQKNPYPEDSLHRVVNS